MADECPTTGATDAPTFNPTLCLSRFESNGGALSLSPAWRPMRMLIGRQVGNDRLRTKRSALRVTRAQRGALQIHLVAQMGKSSPGLSRIAPPTSTLSTAGNAGDFDQRSNQMNMISAIRATSDLGPVEELHSAQPLLAEADPIDRYWASHHAFNAGELGENVYLKAYDEMWAWRPSNDRDFVRKVEAAFADGGAGTTERREQLIAEAVELLGIDSAAQPNPIYAPPIVTPRGTHSLCDDDRGLFSHLPDLRTGRTLEDALDHLTTVAETDIASYAEEWRAEIEDVGGNVSANFRQDGSRHLSVGQACDAQMEERRRRVDALCDHMQEIEGMYESIADLLVRRGEYSDNRPREISETTGALRDFLDGGFSVFLYPDGRLGSSAGMPKQWAQAGPERAAEIEDAARRYARARGRWRNEAQIKRAIRMLGTVMANGFTVLQRKEG